MPAPSPLSARAVPRQLCLSRTCSLSSDATPPGESDSPRTLTHPHQITVAPVCVSPCPVLASSSPWDEGGNGTRGLRSLCSRNHPLALCMCSRSALFRSSSKAMCSGSHPGLLPPAGGGPSPQPRISLQPLSTRHLSPSLLPGSSACLHAPPE